MAKSNEAVFKAEIRDLLERLTSARRPWALRKARRDFERSYVNYIIRASDEDRQRAAKRLKIGFSTLKEKIRET
jgi:DNA-binding NtrC family response regulator